jgi:DNA-binding NtrC family response regulator
VSEKILVLDDDDQLRKGLATYLRRVGFDVVEAGSVAEGQRVLASEDPDLAIVDYQLPDGSAFDVLDAVRERDAGESVIVLTGAGTIDLAVTAIKSGAEHFLTKPVDLSSLEVLVRRALQSQRERRLRAVTAVDTPLDPFIGSSRAIKELETLARTAAEAEVPLLILGETGSGKGVVARFIHDNGPRKNDAFVDVNCAGLSRERGEAELFGYQRGAFAGAVANKPGLYEVAHRGSLFLDEIGDLELGMQPKLSKAIEEGRFRRLGEVGSRSVNVRLIVATHKNLGAMVRDGTFREDLLFRVNALTLKVPALRERPADIPALATSLLASICGRRGRPTPELAPDAAALLSQYAWPGNVRELKNVLERAVLFSTSERLDRSALRFDRVLEPDGDDDLGQTLDDAERRHIAEVLARLGGRVEEAAEALAISRSALYAKLKKYGLKALGS